MNRLNIFLEHIYEACSQNDITLQEMLLQAHDMWGIPDLSATSGGWITGLCAVSFPAAE